MPFHVAGRRLCLFPIPKLVNFAGRRLDNQRQLTTTRDNYFLSLLAAMLSTGTDADRLSKPWCANADALAPFPHSNIAAGSLLLNLEGTAS